MGFNPPQGVGLVDGEDFDGQGRSQFDNVKSLSPEQLSNIFYVDSGEYNSLKSTIEGASEGDLIVVPQGTYNLTDVQYNITVPADKIKIIGSGFGTLLRNENVYAGPTFHSDIHLDGRKDVIIEGIAFQGEQEDGTSDANQSGNHIQVDNSDRITIKEVWALDGRNIVKLDNCSFVNISGLIGLNNEHGISCYANTNNHINISDCIFKRQAVGARTGYLQRGISIANTQHFNIENVHLHNVTDTGFFISGAEQQVCKAGALNNVSAYGDNTGSLVKFRSGGTYDVRDIVISNSTFINESTDVGNNGIEFSLRSDDKLRRILIDNCYIETIAGRPLYSYTGDPYFSKHINIKNTTAISQDEEALLINQADYLEVENCYLESKNSKSNLVRDQDNCRLIDNTYKAAVGSDAINIASDALDCVVEGGKILQGNLNYDLGAAKRIKDVVGGSVASGTATLTTGASPAERINGVITIEKLTPILRFAKPSGTTPAAEYSWNSYFEWDDTNGNWDLVFTWKTDPGADLDLDYAIDIES